MINSKEEQQFVENVLFDQIKIVDNIWLGAKRDPKTKKFHWDDVMHTNFTYENWGEINNDTTSECVEMVSEGHLKGKWTETSCIKSNIVVCQKMQDWTLARLLKEFLDSKKQYEKEIFQLKNTINNLQNNSAKFQNENNELKEKFKNLNLTFENKFSKLNEAMVPIGFIYTQLPNQAEPTLIWPKLKWQEVTSQYADTFFRAQGTETSPFGQVQSEGAPRLSKVNITQSKWTGNNENIQDIITPGMWSKLLLTGRTRCVDDVCQHINFYVSNEEVRPKNTAIKIWKRIQ